MKYSLRNLLIVPLILIGSCSPPDLTNPETLKEAQTEAIPIETLQRKLMFGMLQLYVDKNDEPFSGWVWTLEKKDGLRTLGFLMQGMKEGRWITWDKNGMKCSEVGWHKDYHEGVFNEWHPNGKVKSIGQTRDGEVDGEWLSYYSSGQLASRSLNKIGHLQSIEVWQPNGKQCPETHVENGDGTLLMYYENGTIKLRRCFKQGIEISRKSFNQR